MSYKEKAGLPVAEGGTGQITLTAHSLLIGEGTTAIANTGTGTAGQVVLSGGSSADPAWVTPTAGTGLSVTANASTLEYTLTGGSIVNSITGDTGTAQTGAITLSGGASATGLYFAGSGGVLTGGFQGITANGGTVSLATDATTSTVHIGTGAGDKTVILGSTNSTSAITMQAGSGSVQITSVNSEIQLASGTGSMQISTDATNNSVFLGTGSGNKIVQVGSTTGSSSTSINTGTGGFAVNLASEPSLYISGTEFAQTVELGYNPSVVTTLTLGSTLTASTTLIQGGSSGDIQMVSAGLISIGADNTVSTIDIATAISGVKTLNLGSSYSTSSTSIASGTAGIEIIANDGPITVYAGGGGVSISTDATVDTINIATGAAVKTTTLGSTNSTSTTTVQSGTGALNVTSTNGALTIDAGTGTLGIATDATANTVNIGTGAGVKTVTVGSTNTTSPTTIQSGTGALNVTATGGALTIDSGTGTLGISTDAAATTVNIGTGAAVKGVTLGSTNSTSATTVQSGTGALNVTSTNGPLTIKSGTGTLGIATDATANTVNIGTGAGVKTVTLGSTNTTSPTVIQSGSGSIINNTGLTVSSGGIMTNTKQPCFEAYLATSVTGVTGNGTNYTVIFDTAVFDQSSSYSTSTGFFTAPVTGKYQFYVNAFLGGISASNTTGIIYFNFNNGSNYRYAAYNGNIYTQGLTGGEFCFSGQATLSLLATWTISVTISVAGSATANISVLGTSSTTYQSSVFSGYLIC